jgi:hypothetical protein
MIRFEYQDEQYELPSRFELCPRCEGRGTHVNPAVDGNGISPEEFAEDPDFAESYFSGLYDVPCHTCGGRRVVEVPDEGRCDGYTLELYYRETAEREEYERQREHEIKMGY